MAYTLTFPADQDPTEAEAQAAWRSLVGRLRYRGYLGYYGWVLHRTKRGVLHMHGVAELPWFPDGLVEWRELIEASGFGSRNRLEVAEDRHARYYSRYIATRLAGLARFRRAYGFSRNFPRSAHEQERARVQEVGDPIGLVSECEWVPSHLVQ